MQALLGTVFGLLLAAQIVVLVWSAALLARFPSLLWSRNPWTAGIAGGLLVALALLFWRFRKARRAAAAPDIPLVHPGISLSHIPMAGVPGAVYMLQFAVWVLVTPAVGLFYGVLVGGGLLLAPGLYWLHRRDRAGATALRATGLVGMLGGLAAMSLAASREFSPAILFFTALAAGLPGAALLLWLRSRQPSLSIAPYRQQAG